MHRHYIESNRLQAPSLTLVKEEARHLQTVLRLRLNDEVELFDGRGLTATARVAAAGKHALQLDLLAAPAQHAQPACQLVLFACVSKGKRMDWTIEKSVELGVSRIVPVLSDRTIVRLDEEDAESKTDRWMRVAIEAARQSGTAWVPTIDTPVPLAQVGPLVQACTPVFVAALVPEAKPMRQVLADLRTNGKSHECCASAPLRETAPIQAGWFVGPEGDFTPTELQLLLASGAIPVSLGRQVLRTETAAIWGLCVLGAEWL